MAEYFKPQVIEVLSGQNYTEQDQDHLKVLKVSPTVSHNITRKIVIDPRKSLILIYSYDKFERLLHQEQKDKAIEFVCEANPLIEFGSLEVREERGLMHYRVSQLLPEVTDIRAVFKYMLDQTDLVFPRARAALKEVIANRMTPKDAARTLQQPS